MLFGLLLAVTFGCGDVSLVCDAPGEWTVGLSREVASDGAEVARVSCRAPRPCVPPTFKVVCELPQVGMTERWSVNGTGFRLPADWGGADWTALAYGMPLWVFFNGNDEARFAVAASECVRQVDFKGGVREEGSRVRVSLTYFATPDAPIDRYETRIRLDVRKRPFADAVRENADWIVRMGGSAPCAAPPAAFEPLYSSWYNFHQDVFDRDIEAECARAVKLGMRTLILDDGWQTDDTGRGYAFCGDWQVSARRFPDMATHVKRVQALGMKYMMWYSVPYVGVKSANHARFRGKYLREGAGEKGASVLDPRFPEVRRFLVDTYVKALRDWDIDGFKLDFIDSFRIRTEYDEKDPAVAEDYAGRDEKSIPMAVDRLLGEIKTALTAVKPDILVEFRQNYIGPAIRKYGNMLRVADCPGNPRANRVAIANLRLVSDGTAVHSDMLEWNFAERLQDAALFVINSIFGVVQYSVMLRQAPPAHLKMMEKWIRFSREHRETLLHGKLTPHHPELQYPVIEAESAAERIVGLYDDGRVLDVPDAKRTIVMNATGKDAFVIRRNGRLEEVSCPSGDWIELN